MDGQAFDRLTRLFGVRQARRSLLPLIFGATVAGVSGAGASVAARDRRRRGKGRKNGAKRKRKFRAEAVPPGCYTGTRCDVGRLKNAANCNFEGSTAFVGKDLWKSNLSNANLRGVNATGANFSDANLSGACLVDANLTGANLTRTNLAHAIFCRTTRPDGTRDDSGCGKGTSCCSTCPPDTSTGANFGQPGFRCPGGFCSCGGQCCAGPDCWLVSTQVPNTDPPIIQQRELCTPPDGCQFCPSSGTTCCTACVGPNQECASSGPISGGTIRRRV